MKKLLAMLLVLSMASIANATVLDLVAVNIGQSGDRMGGVEDPLEPSDTIGLKVVLNHNSYGGGYTSYDGYLLSSIDLDLHVSGPGTFSIPLSTKGAILIGRHLNLDPFEIFDVTADGIGEVTAVAPSAILGPADILWDMFLHCDGPGDVTIDLTLFGLSQYSIFGGAGGPEDATEWIDMTEGDLGDLVIHQIPEPITMALLGVGGLLLRRRRR